MQKKEKNVKKIELAAEDIHGNPETPHEMVNKYGTYEIQPTADTKNEFPTIAQGLAKDIKKPTKADGGVGVHRGSNAK